MKKSVMVIAVLSLLLSACNLSIPESVSVKTNANYNYTIGKISQDFSETFKAENLFENLETENNKIYDFFPGRQDQKLQQYILTMKISDISVDPGSSVPAGTHITQTDLSANADVELDISTIFDSIKDVLGEDFVDSASFNEIPLYIYCDAPAGFESSLITGQVTIKYLKNGSSSYGTPIVIGDSDKEIAWHSKPELNITTIGKSENVVDNLLYKSQASLSADLKSLLNENKNNTGKVSLDFDLTFEGTTDGEPIGIIAVNAFIVLPLRFDIANNVDIDLSKLAKNESDQGNEDVFNRSEATDISSMEKYLDVIEKIVINYKTEKNPIATDSNALYVIKSNDPYLRKNLDINEDFLKLNDEEFMEILRVYPFRADINLEIPADAVLSLPRELGLVMDMNIGLYTNGVIKL